MNASSKSERAAYDAPTGRLLLSDLGWSGIGTLDEWEERARFILRAVARQRAVLDQGWPQDFLKQIADV